MSRFLPDTNDCPDVALRVQGLKNVRAIEYDPITQYVYWIRAGEGRTSTIKKSLENKTHSIIMVAGGSGYPFDLALDPVGRLLFWTCSMNDVVNVTRLDSDSNVGVVVKGDGEKPRHIAVHPELRLLFWTDVGDKRRVVQSFMDGKGRIVIATDLQTPTSLAIDIDANVIYFAHGNVIEFADVNGANRHSLADAPQNSIVYLAVLFDYVYW